MRQIQDGFHWPCESRETEGCSGTDPENEYKIRYKYGWMDGTTGEADKLDRSGCPCVDSAISDKSSCIRVSETYLRLLRMTT